MRRREPLYCTRKALPMQVHMAFQFLIPFVLRFLVPFECFPILGSITWHNTNDWSHFIAVVWNPWEKMAKAIPDLGDHDYKNMLYVCSAAFENPIVLKPMEEWKGRQELSAVSSSYCSGQLDPQKVLLYAKLAHPQQWTKQKLPPITSSLFSCQILNLVTSSSCIKATLAMFYWNGCGYWKYLSLMDRKITLAVKLGYVHLGNVCRRQL